MIFEKRRRPREKRRTFVTDGIESALNQTKAAAGDKNVIVMGGRLDLNTDSPRARITRWGHRIVRVYRQ
jgi:hypothetical protein